MNSGISDTRTRYKINISIHIGNNTFNHNLKDTIMLTRMKKQLTLLVAATTLLCVRPAMVKAHKLPDPPSSAAETSLTQKFPNASNAKWEKTPDGKREAFVEFTSDKKKYRVFFDKDGNIAEVQKEIKTKELPEKVLHALQNIYPSERILKAYEIEKAGKKPFYEIVLKLESEKTSLTINKEGLFTMR